MTLFISLLIWQQSADRETMSNTPVYKFFVPLMNYFGPLKLLDLEKDRGMPKLDKVARINFPLKELFKMAGRKESKPKAITGRKSLKFYLFLYFCLHSAFIIVRTFQYVMCPEGTVAMMAANFVWIVTAGFPYIPYHAFVLKKPETEQLIRSWNILEQELLSGMRH